MYTTFLSIIRENLDPSIKLEGRGGLLVFVRFALLRIAAFRWEAEIDAESSHMYRP